MTTAEQTKIIKDLNRSLSESQKELEELRQKSEMVVQHAEASLHAEKSLRDSIAQKERVIVDYMRQLGDSENRAQQLAAEVSEMKLQHERYIATQKLIHDTNEKSIAHLKKALDRALETRQDRHAAEAAKESETPAEGSTTEDEPLDTAGIRKYKDRYVADVDVLRKLLEQSERDKEQFMKQTDELIGTMHSEEEWTRLRAKCEVSESIADKLQQQVQESARALKHLQGQCDQLNVDKDLLATDLKRAKDASVRQRTESARKDALIREHVQKIKDLELAVFRLETKLKTLGAAHHHKDTLLKTLKLKRDDLTDQLDQKTSLENDLGTARDMLRKAEANVTRKDVLVKKWREKYEGVVKELETARTALSSSLDPKSLSTSEKARRTAESRIADLEKRLIQNAAMFDRFKRAVLVALEDVIWRKTKDVEDGVSRLEDEFARIVGGQVDLGVGKEGEGRKVEREVFKKAEVISRQVLDLELQDVLQSDGDSGYGQSRVEERLQDM
ncbi:hypothetical protein HK097_008104 [Rhizophlyctis rosea]|uniref:Uncharacterized protein n=1 Tax=Rhizophlyctis rosea TaxID=64517 RepID=A0AAD5X1W0_9FUNG|nr:hypothetical protein HK097_008104 [Rhizophlyctis rosea]